MIFYDMFRSRAGISGEPDEGSSVVVMILSVSLDLSFGNLTIFTIIFRGVFFFL